ncbi:glycosyltransferase family 2 protein [Rhodopirellula sp. MGV]|uniref:glycosyltransferase family 2 protein n=1 Tax=Rhodopirellula sp. MGV TaxID=2023130 RepID=UPI000B961F2A|nr:glycosyltransferase family 2 protein [Rhodopirellula sp. MGV]OYP36953.1 hypothetical protein CGZ80_06205 [Rhodopirellula sp. MGV]PNY36285.1 glycosyltransferase family 2 protein [Rhodopirellula baltica]
MPDRISIVLPIRNREHEIANRVEELIRGLMALLDPAPEILLVDDGSRDRTPEICQRLAQRYDSVRYLRHDRPRGMEAAGQTGLERSGGDVVFIQEGDVELNFIDLQHLLRLIDDPSILAARAESLCEPVSEALVRRVRLWGVEDSHALQSLQSRGASCGLQMVRRSNVQRLTAHGTGQAVGKRYRLEGKSKRLVSLARTQRRVYRKGFADLRIQDNQNVRSTEK